MFPEKQKKNKNGLVKSIHPSRAHHAQIIKRNKSLTHKNFYVVKMSKNHLEFEEL